MGTTEGRREVGIGLDQTVVLEHVDVLVGAGFVKSRPRQARLIGGDRGSVGAAEEGDAAPGPWLIRGRIVVVQGARGEATPKIEARLPSDDDGADDAGGEQSGAELSFG